MSKVLNRRSKSKGFTLVEMVVALPLMLIIFTLIWGSYITLQKLFPGGMTQVALQSYGRSALGRVSSNVRYATSTSVNVGGDTLTITLDPNLTYNDLTDDVTATYTVSGTDIIYDPDTSVDDNDVVLLENVAAVTGIPHFQKNQDLIVITFKVTRTNIIFGTQNCSLSTTIKVRGSDD